MIFVSVLAIALAAQTAEENEVFTRPDKPARGIASVMSPKEQMLNSEFKRAPQIVYTEKLQGPLATQIELVGAKPMQIGDRFVLHGVVLAQDGDLSGVDFKWSLPQGVRLVSGAMTGRLDVVGGGQSQSVEITLEKTTNENVKVHFLAGSTQGSSRFSQSAQYNTDIQDKLDAERVARKGAIDAQPEQRKSDLKVFQ